MEFNPQKCHPHLVTYFSTQPLHLDGNGENKPNIRKLVEEPWQLAKTGKTENLENYLMTYDIIQAKVDAGLIEGLIADFERDKKICDEVKLIGQAIRLSSNVVRKDSSQLAGQLIGRLYKYKEEAAISILSQSVKYKSRTWLKPGSQALIAPGISLTTTLTGHTDWVQSVTFSQDGKQIYSVSDYGTIRSWDFETGKESFSRNETVSSVNVVIYNSIINHVMYGDKNGGIFFRDIKSGIIKKADEKHKCEIRVISVNHTGSYAISLDSGSSAFIWDLNSQKVVHTILFTDLHINTIALSEDGEEVFVGSVDGKISQILVKTCKTLRTWQAHKRKITAMGLVPGTNHIISGSTDGLLYLWNINNREQLKEFKGHHGMVLKLVISNDGSRLISNSTDMVSILWDITSGQEVKKLIGHSGWITSAAFSPCGNYAVTGSQDRTVRIWKLNNNIKDQHIGNYKPEALRSLSFFESEKSAIGLTDNGTINFWYISNRQTLNFRPASQLFVTAAAGDPHKPIIALGTAEGKINLYDVASENCMMSCLVCVTPVGAIAIVDDCLFSSGQGGSIHKRNIFDSKITGELKGHTSHVNALVYCSKSGLLLSASDDRTIKVWEIQTGKCLRTLKGHEWQITCLAGTPDGKVIVSGSLDYTLRIWNSFDEKQTGILNGHMGWINSVGISANGIYAVSGSNDCTLRLWHLPSLSQIAEYTFDSEVLTSVVNTNGDVIIAGDRFGNVIFLDVMNDNIFGSLYKHQV